MKYKEIIRFGIIVTEIMLAIVTMISLVAFAKTADQTILTNALLVILIMTQIFMSTVIISVYTKEGRR
jgi:hypothetical protein